MSPDSPLDVMPSEANKGSIYPGLCPEGEVRRGVLVGLEMESTEPGLFSYHDVVSDLEFHQEDAKWNQFPDLRRSLTDLS